MLKKILYSLVCMSVVISVTSCGNSNSNKVNSEFSLSDSAVGQGKALDLSESVMSEDIQNISSPVETASLIKKSGTNFSEKILNKTENADKYNTSFKQALNLGVYSCDLGYINTFDKGSVVIPYLLTVNDLADNIRVGQFFDFNALKKLATNSSNLDSLMEVSVSSFNEMDDYLRQNKRSNLSALIVTGAWVESLYLTAKVYEDTNDENIRRRIGEQKEIIDILLIVMQNYSSDEEFAEMTLRLEQLKQAYSGVRITTEYAEPKKIEKDGSLIIVQNEISHVEMDKTELQQITKEIYSLRDFVVL